MAAAVRGSGVLVVVCQGDARLTLLLVTHLRRPDVQVLVVQTVSEGPLPLAHELDPVKRVAVPGPQPQVVYLDTTHLKQKPNQSRL